ncbi:MAG: hypothetical protein ACO2PM_11550 [Pyrobaculum sp.]|jgi:hypothetical protein
MHPTKLIPALALLLTAAVALAQDPSASIEPLSVPVPGTRPTILYDNCYPNACVDLLHPTHWPFSSIPRPRALVAIGSPAFGDYYNLTNQLLFLGVFLNPPVSRWFGRPITPGNIRSGLGNRTTGIGIGFTALGEFVATLDNGIGGGLALARYNTATSDLEKTETWATKDIGFIRPADWVNGWTLSANLTIKDDATQKNYWIFLHAFAVYSNGTHAGGGRGVALNLTIKPYGSPLSYPPTGWRLLPFDSSDIKPFTIVYDSPRLLIATGGVKKTIDLSILNTALQGAEVIIDVNFTLIFPKAWPYAIVYYNYSLTVAMASKLLPFPMYLNSTAFSIRFEIDQVNGAPPSNAVGSYNATIFTLTSCGGVEYNLLHATPHGIAFQNITMFAAVYPKATEFTPWRLNRFVPSRSNNFDIVLPTGYQRATLASEGRLPGSIPFVILQWSSGPLDFASEGGVPATYKNGVMFVYGYAYNVTNWVAANSPDPYIRALVERTVLHLPTFVFDGTAACGHFHWFRLGVVGSMADPTDVFALSYGAHFFPLTWSWFGLDVAPGAFQNLYTGSAATGMAGFIGLRNFGGLPVVLARRSMNFPYFYDSYNRFALNKTFMLNTLRVMAEFDPSTAPPSVYRFTTLTVGGPVVNMFTRYTQDFAWYAPFIHNYTTAPFPFSFSNYYMAHSPYIGSLFTTVWNSERRFTANNAWPPVTNAPTMGYAIISTAVDPNGTVIMQIWGANTQDTYYAAKLLKDQSFAFFTSGAPVHIIVFTYRYNWPFPYSPPPPFFVVADVYRLSPIMRPEHMSTYRLRRVPGVPVDIKFLP